MSLLDPRAMRDWCKKTFLNKGDVLKTRAEVEENTEEGKSADALVVKEVFQSVSDGKNLIASAITDKGVQTDAAATFKEMADNINNIQSGGENTSPIESPYLFQFSGSTIPFSTGAGSFTFPVPVNKVTKFLIKTFQFSLSKSATSNASGSFYFRIRGTLESGTSGTIKQWTGSVAQNSTSTQIVNIYNTDTEVDLTGYKEVTGIQIGKFNANGTVVNISANITFKAELYF